MAMEIKYKGVTYEMDKEYWGETSLNDSAEFQYFQIQSCIESKDFVTLQNRITAYLLHGGIKIKK